ncbi:MAG: thioredoxin family protein [Bacillota bacterium]
MMDVNKENFDRLVLQDPGLVVVDFWSPKCEPCLAMEEDLEFLASGYAGRLTFARCNILENRRLALGQRVLGVPALVIYRAGEKLWQGATLEELENQLAHILGQGR